MANEGVAEKERNGTAILRAEGIVKQFGSKRALDGVSFEISKGDFLSLFGPNGAGKTTLLKTIATIVQPTAGHLYFDGESVTDRSIFLRAQIGFVSHNYLLYDDLTARENLVFFGRMYGVVDLDDRIDFLLDRVGLTGRQHDLVRTFSRGMIQRLSIARAILHDPEILLFDEPYTGLDIQATKVLDDLLEELKKGRHTFIMTSHDIDKGFEHATRVAILARGRIVFDAPKDAVDKDAFAETFWQWVDEK